MPTTDIILISQHDPESGRDPRIVKYSEVLTGNGWTVQTVALASIREHDDSVPGTEITYLAARVSKRLRPWVTAHPLNPVTGWVLLRHLASTSPRLVLSRDLRLAPVTRLVTWLLGVPHCLDLGENMPAMVRSERQERGQHPAIVWVFVLITRLVELLSVWAADTVVVVSPQNKKRLDPIRRRARRLPAFVVRNVPSKAELTSGTHGDSAESGLGATGELRLLYVGVITPLRGLNGLVAAVAGVRSVGRSVRLDIVGAGPGLTAVRTAIAHWGLEGVVEAHGWMSGKDMDRFLAEADVGVIPHRKNSHTDSTIPNKIFDYWAWGLPVLSTNLEPLVDLITHAGAGWIVEDGASGLRRGLDTLTTMTREEIAARGEAGRRCVWYEFNWETEIRGWMEWARAVAPPSGAVVH